MTQAHLKRELLIAQITSFVHEIALVLNHTKQQQHNPVPALPWTTMSKGMAEKPKAEIKVDCYVCTHPCVSLFFFVQVR